jgi:predicted signal transduction protein with EAL and GGDEF domain
LGGDEFALFVSESDIETVTVLAERIHNLMTAPFTVANRRFTLGASIGVAMSRDEMGFDELYRRADMAMHRAKRLHGGVHFYDAKADQQLRERAYLEQELRQAIRTGQLQLHYQPILSLETGICVTAEALLRWHHPERGDIPPGNFIPLAEDTGLINTIDRYVLKQALIDAKARDFSVTVNISPKTLRDHNFVPYLKKMLKDFAFDTSRLCLEITEQVLARPEETLEVIRAIHKLGCRIAVDDFGVGYSSLSYLTQYPLDILKLDRSFTQGAQRDPKTAAIAEGILHLAKQLGLRTLAEGIEEEAHITWLKARDCELGQGFFLIRPKPVEEFDRHRRIV